MSVFVVCGAETKRRNTSCVCFSASGYVRYPIPQLLSETQRWQKYSHSQVKIWISSGVLLVFDYSLGRRTSKTRCETKKCHCCLLRCLMPLCIPSAHVALPRCAPCILHSSASLANLQRCDPAGSRRCQRLLVSMEPVELQSLTLLTPKPPTAARSLRIFFLLFILKRSAGCHRHTSSYSLDV